MSVPIPQPPRVPFLGNVTSIDRDVPLNGFMLLAKQYGEIYKLEIRGTTVVYVNTYALQQELSNESRFHKFINPNLMETRHLIGDGLFTVRVWICEIFVSIIQLCIKAHSGEQNWGIAHRLLMPAFNAGSIRGMYPDMQDMCDQLLKKWERFGPEHVIDPSDDYTRVALDTLALCTMSYRLNSFYTEGQPKFAQAMSDWLKECFRRANRPSIVQAMMPGATHQFEEDQNFMKSVAQQIVDDRRAHPLDKKDVLNTMLSADPKTGERLSDDSIIKNMITFLVAGHETSSGTLSFMTYYLLKNPETWRKLQNEVDEITGGQPPKVEDLSKMTYLQAVMRETLRVSATAPTRTVAPLEDTLLGGKYFVKAETPITIQVWMTQRDPLVWGADANEFHPERMLDGKFEALPPNAWQPFGFGTRGCIGRPFAWQEIQLVMSSVVQKFDLYLDDPAYTLELQQGLTVKPKNLRIRAKLRHTAPRLYATPSSQLLPERTQNQSKSSVTPVAARKPMYILYGSNTGTSEGFAQRIANDSTAYGFSAQIGTLDSATGNIPTDGPVVVITASYEGQPADNAARFIDWLTSLKGDELKSAQYAVFGCGNSDWVRTFQRIPLLCDKTIESRGGERLLPPGLGDSGKGDFFEVFDDFEAKLWKALTEKYSTTRAQPTSVGFEVTTVDAGTSRASALRQSDIALGTVKENKILTQAGQPVKRHIEFELPEGLTYRAGDYLAILPQNPPRDVLRVLAHFNLSNEQLVVLSSVTPTSLPTDKPASLYEVLLGYVELSQPATTQDLRLLSEAATTDSIRAALGDLRNNYQEKVLGPRLSVLDILEKYSPDDIKLSLGVYLRMLPPMRVRQYSISSSPLWNPQHVTLTISVLESLSLADKNKTFLGVGSNYLAQLLPGYRVSISVRASHAGFHPPEDPSTPIIAFAAGSGLAPLRGFIQERGLQKSSGRDVGKIMLFFGCRDPEGDYIYQQELEEWVKLGVLDVRPAFSKVSEKSEGCKYIQHRLWHDRIDMTELFKNNAQIFVCGSGRIAKEVSATCVRIVHTLHPELNEDEAAKRLDSLMQGRYAIDVFD
ncbi:hypothetical protein D9758_004480 [Tetrapyrgos nigripes]|uniref:Cytochrome P450 n=1 Tax=Tetrapyrgos nigripes TaxID=182062 RepID=A0A8H5GNH0_9AGAR|nr:hypothetical protein D9758_004480 [Tetrapyrgos nigripes]